MPDRAARHLDTDALKHLVGYAATRAAVQLKKVVTRHLGPLDLKAVEFSILVVLAHNDEVNHKQLCDTLDLSPPNLAVIVDRLEERGLVQRVRSTSDRRETFVALTPEGQALQQRATEIARTMETESLAMLSAGERMILVELLLKVARGPAPTA